MNWHLRKVEIGKLGFICKRSTEDAAYTHEHLLQKRPVSVQLFTCQQSRSGSMKISNFLQWSKVLVHLAGSRSATCGSELRIYSHLTPPTTLSLHEQAKCSSGRNTGADMQLQRMSLSTQLQPTAKNKERNKILTW